MLDLLEMAQKPCRKVVGLMSGTSADGIDAALVRISGSGLDMEAHLLYFKTYPFPSQVREDLFKLFDPSTATVDEVCRMNFLLGESLAEAARNVVEEAGLKLEEVDLIGSHGQTIRHLPGPECRYGYTVPSTLQIGEPCVIAERTGVTTVADFRPRDIAAGGEGAPLVPLVDYLLFRSEEKGRGMLNIGGISNITVLPPKANLKDVVAFDLGPGNMVIDFVVAYVTQGERQYDRGGALARKGRVHPVLLEELLDHPFLWKPPPKSAGRENFGAPFSAQLIDQARPLGISGADLVATVTAFGARSISDGIRRFARKKARMDEILVSGGGAFNRALMEQLRELLAPISIHPLEHVGMSGETKEAIAFAVLANETLLGNFGNLPGATGASRPVVLGKIVPGRRR